MALELRRAAKPLLNPLRPKNHPFPPMQNVPPHYSVSPLGKTGFSLRGSPVRFRKALKKQIVKYYILCVEREGGRGKETKGSPDRAGFRHGREIPTLELV